MIFQIRVFNKEVFSFFGRLQLVCFTDQSLKLKAIMYRYSPTMQKSRDAWPSPGGSSLNMLMSGWVCMARAHLQVKIWASTFQETFRIPR